MECDGLSLRKGSFQTSGNLPCMTSFFRLLLTKKTNDEKNQKMINFEAFWTWKMSFHCSECEIIGIKASRLLADGFFWSEATGQCCRRKMWPASSPAANWRFFNKVVSNEFWEKLVGGFKYFSFSSLLGEMIQLDEHIFQRIYKGYPPGNDHTSTQKCLYKGICYFPGGEVTNQELRYWYCVFSCVCAMYTKFFSSDKCSLFPVIYKTN